MKRLSTKMMLGLLVLVVITLSMLWLYQVVYLEENYVNRKIKGIESELQSVYGGDAVPTETQVNEALEEIAFRNNLGIERLSQSGETLFITGTLMQGMPRAMGRMNPRTQVLEEAMGGAMGRMIAQHTRFQSNVILLGMSVERAGLGELLLITMPLEPIEETVALLKEQLSQLTLVLILLTLVIGFMMARMIVQPISLLTAAATRVARGNLDTRVPVKSRDEIGRLTEAFNNMAQQLGQVETVRREFIANVSHELRTPLSLIQGYAETIRDLSGDDPARRTRHAGIILDESLRLSQIVNDMLALSRLQSGSLPMKKEPVDLNNILLRVENTFALMAEKQNVQLSCSLTSESIVVADPGRMEQVLVNLVGNAFHFTPGGGNITLALTHESGNVKVSVTDTGSGISEGELDQIWERYYRSTRHHPGSFQTGAGLGLAIVKNILEAHGASYGVNSIEGQGTVFWFTLKTTEENQATTV